MIISLLQKNKFFRGIVNYFGRLRAKSYYGKIKGFLRKSDKIIDIGSGTCNVSKLLLDKGFKVTPVDITNLSFEDNVSPVIYDGKKLPFKKGSFDASLLLTVLHHTPCPEKVLKEALRVSDKVIIMEDVYGNSVHKHLTHFFDSLLNLEFFGHPHSNKSDKEWKGLFKRLNLKLVGFNYHNFLVFRIAAYSVEKL